MHVRKAEQLWVRVHLERKTMQLHEILKRPLVTEKNADSSTHRKVCV